MTDDDVAGWLDGADGPRPLPEPLRDRLASELVPRPLAEDVRGRLVTALTTAGAAQAHQSRTRARIGIAAAAIVAVIGLLAVVTTSGGPEGVPVAASEGEKPARPRSTPRTAPPTVPETVPPVTVVAMSESDPVYARLAGFASCGELLEWARSRAAAEVTAYGLDAIGIRRPIDSVPVARRSDVVSAPSRAALTDDSVSLTNVQEAGVDEPDGVKADGRALYVLQGNDIHVVGTSEGVPVLLATVPPPSDWAYAQSLVLDGDRLVVLGSVAGEDQRVSTARILDVADPAVPTEVIGLDVPGAIVDARMVDRVVHIVSSWRPGPFDFSYPEDDADVERALEANRQVVLESTIEQWLPPGVGCTDVNYPRDLAGFSTTVITSFPVSHPEAISSSALLADAGTVYASTDRLVVGTQRWEYAEVIDPAALVPPTVRTNLHLFDLADDGARYRASGSVPGFLRSSYALSARDGYLRVASTDRPPGGAPDGPSTISTVTVLREDGEVLVPVGAVGGLGADQHIRGVRFAGDVAFVVTYRQTDPLYVIDLSDPTDPTVRGALEITGFSGYLHPLDDGRLLGVGIEADESGAFVGGAVSIYDVRDPDNPLLAHRHVDPTAWFLATDEPHAFLYWEPTGLLVLPASDRAQAGGGARVLHVGDGVVSAQGVVSHAPHVAAEYTFNSIIHRAVMVDSVLFTVSAAGVLSSETTSLGDRGWAPFPQPQ